ncbi:Na+/H+ antiporter NhaA [Flavobacterium sp. '19STA2R22 D10 B1']|uniref:Na+/H+ antiporter NhaA n=1 Tax=Flavobacterium aerium TaxID=3037261 RepID=UPI00278C5B69|nr:Na+/H+ antiporter NhaA [Flavobacterium sp. '19STA2R22 D10 B1']
MDIKIKITPVDKWIINPVNNFISKSTTGGIVLFISAIVAIFMANSPWAHWYHEIWEHKIGIALNDTLHLNLSLHHWINDGLMAIFFFVVGLELKREIITGELSNVRKAFLPIAAAIGGMIFPALIYIVLNHTGEVHAGWGIPMATDIAFALGVLYLLGDRIPTSLKVFLTALAIVDDLGAVLVIAFFYTSSISYISLSIGLAFLAVLYIANKIGVRNTLFYAIVGIAGVWLPFLMSGVHATIAAVLVAFTIPIDIRIEETQFVHKMKVYLERFSTIDPQNKIPTLTNEQMHTVEEMKDISNLAIPPLQKLEHALHPFVTFIIMPVFALANAGVAMDIDFDSLLETNVAVGVVLGLIVGKFIGVFGLTSILIKLKIAVLPDGMTTKHLIGVGLLAGIGFTMSLFVTTLAFTHPEYQLQAKIGILIGSFISGVLGYLVLKSIKKDAPQNSGME